MNNQNTRDPAAMNTFSSFLGAVEDGQLHHDLTKSLQSLVADLHDHIQNVAGTAKGSISINLGFKLEGGVIEVAADFKTTGPKRVGGKSIFWATPDNLLTPRNPKQMDMLRDVNRRDDMRAV